MKRTSCQDFFKTSRTTVDPVFYGPYMSEEVKEMGEVEYAPDYTPEYMPIDYVGPVEQEIDIVITEPQYSPVVQPQYSPVVEQVVQPQYSPKPIEQEEKGIIPFSSSIDIEVKLTDNDQLIIKHYQNGVLHRDDGPAVIAFRNVDPNSIKGKDTDFLLNWKATPRVEKWYKNGVLHRQDGPAYLFIENGVITRARLMSFGDFPPAWVRVQDTEGWFLNGIEDRLDGGPTFTNYALREQRWVKNGQYHRIGGPALIFTDYAETDFFWFENGKYKDGEYIMDGETVRLSKEEAQKILDSLDNAVKNFKYSIWDEEDEEARVLL